MSKWASAANTNKMAMNPDTVDCFGVWCGDSMTSSPSLTAAMENSTLMEQDEEMALNKGSFASLIFPRITAVLSLFAVLCVFIEAWKDLRQGNEPKSSSVGQTRIRSSRASANIQRVNHIQLFYQIPLFCFSLALALGTTPVPSALDVWGAAGTTASCSFQGFLLQFGVVGTVGWDAALSATYLMMTRERSGTPTRRDYKNCYHLLIWPIALALSIYPLATDLYNFSYSTCWIHEFPNNCHETDSCIRGDGAVLWSSLVSFGVMLHLVYSITIMICLYCTIRGIENRTRRTAAMNHNSTTLTEQASQTSRTYSRAVGIQGMLYTSGMILTMLPTAIYVPLFNATGLWSEGFSVFALSMSPLVGYVNFVIFMRHRRLEDCHTRYAKLLRRLHGWLFDCDWVHVCRCECQCLPLRFRRNKNHSGLTAPSSDFLVPTPFQMHQHHLPSHFLSQSEGAGPVENHNNTPTRLPPLCEEDDDTDSTSVEDQKRGFFSGMMIKAKQRLWLSELGLSSVGRSEEDDGSDHPPELPTRMRSEVERPPQKPARRVSTTPSSSTTSLNSDPSHRSPKQPVRQATQLEEDSEELGCGPDSSLRPPSNPVRYHVSEIHPVPEGDGSPRKPIRHVSEFDPVPEATAEGAPSIMPIRYVREMELPDLQALNDDNEVPPAKRAQTEPPSKPTRFVSEIESEEVPSRHVRDGQAPPSKPIRFLSSVEFPVMGTTIVEEEEPPITEAPPTKPTRYPSDDFDTSVSSSE